MTVYTSQMRLRNRHVNLYRRMRTSTLFELLQEVSICHTEELGMGREMTLDRGLLWVLTLQRAEIIRMPEYGELVTMETWPGNTMHLLFPRYCRLLGENGELLASSSALWALMDSETRRMVFPDRYGVKIDGVVTGKEIALPSPPRRAAGEHVSRFTVPFSYVDLNGHMNNTRYYDLAEDLLPVEAVGRSLREISVEYANEAKLGDELAVMIEADGGTYYVSGETDRKIFRMLMRYE
jgi:Acyl-ACP thioesterase